jgi:hypothetical protein
MLATGTPMDAAGLPASCHSKGQSTHSRLGQLLVLQLLNTLIYYFHGRVQTVNLVDGRLANSRGIWSENGVAHGMESQPKFALLHEFVEEI